MEKALSADFSKGPIVEKRYTHTRTEDAETITIVWNTGFTYAIYVFVVLIFAGLYLGGYYIVLSPLGGAGLIAQFVYSLIYYKKDFFTIEKAKKEYRVDISGDTNSPATPLTFVIQKGASKTLKKKPAK